VRLDIIRIRVGFELVIDPSVQIPDGHGRTRNCRPAGVGHRAEDAAGNSLAKAESGRAKGKQREDEQYL